MRLLIELMRQFRFTGPCKVFIQSKLPRAATLVRNRFFKSSALIIAALMLLSVSVVAATAASAAPKRHGHGLRPPTARDHKWDRTHLIVTQSVGLNQEGLNRINAERAKKNLPAVSYPVAKAGTEAVGLTAEAISNGQVVAQASAPPTLPGLVDNSTSTAFPPVANQNSEGSCCAFACGYYTMTYMVAKQLGVNAQTGGNSTWFSPKFLYNLVNGGADNGTWITVVYQAEQQAGAPLWSIWPYDTNYTAWPTTASVWRSAIPYRMGATGQINSIGSAVGLQQLKTMLTDGYVLNVGTDIDGWHFVTGGVGSYAKDSTYAGQSACNFVGGPFDSSGHCLTIVGYDDTMWIDVNGNGKVDPGEIGAFKVVNQWGTSGWGTNGYAWISYDALKATTAVIPGSANWNGGGNRETAFWYSQAYWINARPAYTPKLLGQVVVSSADRDTMYMEPGVSATSATAPSNTAASIFNGPYAGDLGFTGTTATTTATLVMDYSDIATSGSQKYYVDVDDGDTLTISSFQLTDASGNVLATATNNVPIVISSYSNTTFPYVSYALTDATSPAAVTNLGDTAATTTSITLTWTAPGNDGASGLAASYRLAYSTSPINASNFSSLTPVTGVSTPQISGSTESFTVNNLTPGTTYYFAITTTDSSGNTSALSNVFSDTTPTVLAQTSGATLTSGTAGLSYSTTFSASGGKTAYSWSLPNQYTETDSSVLTTLSTNGTTNWSSTGGVWNYTFPTGFTFPMGGTTYSSVEVGASGYLDFSHSIQDLSSSTTDFINNPVIAPYWQYSQPNNIYITGTASQVEIGWSSEVPYDDTIVNTQVILSPSGQITIQYASAAVGGSFYGGSNIVGVSSGNGTDYNYSNYNGSQNIPANTQLVFTPVSLPAGLTLNGTTGALSGTPTTSGTFTFPIRVADSSYPPQTAMKTYTLVVAANPNPPSITLQPVSQTIDQGQSATFTVASAGGNLSYQWKLGGVNLTNGSNISGATSSTLTITNAQLTNSGTYTCYVSNTLGNATSNGAVLTVSSGPIVSITSPGTTAVGVPNITNSLVLTASATSAITNSPTVTWSMVSGPGTVTFANANAASTSATFSTTGTYVLQATANDGFLSSSSTLTVGAGVAVSSTGSTEIDQLNFSGAGDGVTSTGTIGGSTWTSLCSSQSGTVVTSSATTQLANLKDVNNNNSGIQFTWTNSFAFNNGSRGDADTTGTITSGTATDGLSTFNTSGVTFTNGSEFFPWGVIQSYNAVHDGTDGYASFKLSSSTPMAYTFWLASSFQNGAPSLASNLWPTLLNIGGTYSKTNASFTGGTTLSLQGSQSQSSDGYRRFSIGKLSTTGGFLSTYNPATGLYELNVQVGSGTTSTSTGAVLNGIILQAVQTFTVNNAPQVGTGSVSSPVPGLALSLSGTSSDDGLPTGSTLTTTWSLASGPASVSFANPSAASTTVTFPQGGTYTLTLSASDGSASVLKNLTVSVPYIPVILSGSSLGTTTTGAPFSYQILANDSPTSYSASGLPSGLTINPTTGLISGTPTTSGVFNVTINAINANGTGSSNMTITINAGTTPPSTDTPTMPQWALIFLGGLLCVIATRGMPGSRQT
jgi:C1A family cysteine protease